MKGFLDEKREEIAGIDEDIVRLLRRRLDIAREIGMYKAGHGLEAKNAAVEEKVVSRYRSLAEELGMSPSTAEAIAREIMKESVANEEELIGRGTD